MTQLKRKQYVVTVRQGVIQPRGGVAGPLDRHFTVWAKTKATAKSAAKSAGIHGVIISVESAEALR